MLLDRVMEFVCENDISYESMVTSHSESPIWPIGNTRGVFLLNLKENSSDSYTNIGTMYHCTSGVVCNHIVYLRYICDYFVMCIISSLVETWWHSAMISEEFIFIRSRSKLSFFWGVV